MVPGAERKTPIYQNDQNSEGLAHTYEEATKVTHLDSKVNEA